jgi:hypothetical protein
MRSTSLALALDRFYGPVEGEESLPRRPASFEFAGDHDSHRLSQFDDAGKSGGG